MARDLYNLIWIGPEEAEGSMVGALWTELTVERRERTTRGVILFPALMTPLVHVMEKDEPWLEVLIATEQVLTPDMVNRQLKISRGLRPTKPFNREPLFGGAGDRILVERARYTVDSRGAVLATHHRFAGILHPTVLQMLEDARLEAIYRVRVHKDALPAEGPVQEQGFFRSEPKFIEYRLDGGALKRVEQYSTVSRELHDVLIRQMIERRFGPEAASGGSPLPGQGRYTFPIKGNSVDLAKANPLEPVQSYHPLVVFSGQDAFSYANLGHMSDVHVNCRWQILGRSTARVIEHGEGQYEEESPKIGNLLGETNRSFFDVLHGVAGSDVEVVIIGGDLVDHIRNAYAPRPLLSPKPSVQQIWDAMALDARYDTKQTYPPGVDLVAFYSFLLHAMVKHQKPFFGVSGNHDCYEDAYGISPRVAHKLANGGIPADLNLTFYEALLAFGPTAGVLTTINAERAVPYQFSSFTPEWFEWYHLVLSPFQDWWHKLPRQSLVGLGWGGAEDLLVDAGGEQGPAHLPRADQAISGAQLGLLQQAVNERGLRNVILTTHFTFLSYREDLPMLEGRKPGARGELRLEAGLMEGYSRWDLGTFEGNRAALLDMLAARQIQCVLSGHSHRRGLYLLLDRDPDGTIPARIYDPFPGPGIDLDPLPNGAKRAEPAIIVSDSGGPYPKYNRDGEFIQWGTDRPSGTLVRFDPRDGRLVNVSALAAHSRPKPRAAVAMDYLDIAERAVFKSNRINVAALSPEWDSGAGGPQHLPGYHVFLNLDDHVTGKLDVFVRRIVFAAVELDFKTRIRVELENPEGLDMVLVPVDQTRNMRQFLRAAADMSRFVSLQLGTRDPWLAAHYDWKSYWNFEVLAAPQYNGQSVIYSLMRGVRSLRATLPDWTWREVPAWDWRVAKDPKYAR